MSYHDLVLGGGGANTLTSLGTMRCKALRENEILVFIETNVK